ncbi:hypothetical protein CONCODRAFT_18490 [Conidiobolus coronatus NRRL 28638]|uniref:Uncharacterized protein n=1 Tax=Conidiobolus coronatus (strain ATCC 28846 / CBS 209.66 / NRRL 28638) TaxID=796925 RepID=A0A137P2B5_CONC2|nr:hypothetical protein CONCODRAFT_18490 [Conidiobolus coronatus NRRL 28638]|eukprot:KXN69180.1 hypothetical protein CONCODRAFT_18490 [Conidiobolus coronatus NRRL 28638]
MSRESINDNTRLCISSLNSINFNLDKAIETLQTSESETERINKLCRVEKTHEIITLNDIELIRNNLSLKYLPLVKQVNQSIKEDQVHFNSIYDKLNLKNPLTSSAKRLLTPSPKKHKPSGSANQMKELSRNLDSDIYKKKLEVRRLMETKNNLTQSRNTHQNESPNQAKLVDSEIDELETQVKKFYDEWLNKQSIIKSMKK